MKILATLAILMTLSAGIGCGRHTETNSQSKAAPVQSGRAAHYEDKYFALDYPPEYAVKGTPSNPAPGMTPVLVIEPVVPLRESGAGIFSFSPDTQYPDMMVEDAARAWVKQSKGDGGRVLGGIRKLAVKNGACAGMVEVAPLARCMHKVGFNPVNGKCHAVDLMAFCESPAHKRFVLSSSLGDIPTLDKLTPEAAAIGKAHEHILSTLEFK